MLMTTGEFAKKYGVSRQAVLKMIISGKIKAEKVAGYYMIDENANVPVAWKHGEKGRRAWARYGNA